jgi:hypothetical protein
MWKYETGAKVTDARTRAGRLEHDWTLMWTYIVKA